MSDDKVYIYQKGRDNIEVVLTGRTAKRKVGRNREVILHEIKPKDEDLGFADWIQLDKLFVIED